MTVKKALKILGLKTPYTEEDLKKTYRALIVMTHPDSGKQHDYEKELFMKAYSLEDVKNEY